MEISGASARLQKNLEGARRHCRICGSHSLTDGTQDMKPQRQRSQDATGFLSLGVDEEWEKLHEAKPVEMSLIGEGGEEEKGTQPKPEQGAASGGEKEIGAEEEAEEGSDGGPDGPCAPGAINDENHEASDDSGGEPGEQRQEEQPLQAVVQRQQPWDREQVVQRPMITLGQVQELERIFRYNAYPNLFMRQQIARRIDMPEARVQVWFKNRRAKWRRHQRALMFRNMPPVVLGPPVFIPSRRPFNAIFIPQPAWIWVLEPLPLGPPLLPMPPFPPLLLPPPPLFLAPLPPWGMPPPGPHGWAWFHTTSGPFIAPIF
ncbi:rhox homeobox family member 2-like isoform X2 [Pteropus medius]|uniref:rhox homeobox family member 2-like isoform X2 n=1 Tax=Pteropus vampyrus TaxID=132908 RepID=UPI00196AECBD|nr:rhox homeobox family member 2-like isoform X2 [Pteropus giganteus]